MSNSQPNIITNTLKQKRLTKNWSQQKLAELTNSKISRAEISAIETGRITPSTAVALTLAKIFNCKVEDLFCLLSNNQKQQNEKDQIWAWKPNHNQNNSKKSYTRLYRADIQNKIIIFPAQPTLAGTLPHDGYQQNQKIHWTENNINSNNNNHKPDNLLVIAGCDPAVGLLANECARCNSHQNNNIRLLPITRSSKQALQMLAKGLVHMAGIHLTNNQNTAKNALGHNNNDYRLLRITTWEEGLALNPSLKCKSIKSAVKSINRQEWVAREPGSGARKCMDKLFRENKKYNPQPESTFKIIAGDHNNVAEAIRRGWGQAGICVKLTAAEAELDFLSVQTENYDLCYHKNFENDPRFKHIINIIRSENYKQKLGELPGYNSADTGLIINVK